MNSNAPGQFLGYALQVPRALLHLLRARPGDTVCVEVLGDVATITADGHLDSEEDKSSITDNPLTDRSTDLWKTFYNWVTAIHAGEINIHKTNFIIYCNKSGRAGIVNEFDAATSQTEAETAILNAKNKLVDIREAHSIWNYYDFVMNKNKHLLVEVIQRFELQIGDGASYDEVDRELVCMHLPARHIPDLVENLSGWLHKKISEMIASKQPARITWDDFTGGRVCLDREQEFISGNLLCLEFMLHPVSAL